MNLNLKPVAPFALALAGGIVFAFPASAVQYWAQGATEHGGWFDFGQQGSTSCGRAASASLIYWWQRESGLENPAHDSVDAIFSQIEKEFSDSGDPQTGGSFVHDCVRWYMGEYYPAIDMEKTFWKSDRFWFPGYPELSNGTVRGMSDLFKDRLSKGLLIGLDTGAHAVTVWGAEFDDATGIVSKIWVADPSLQAESNALEIYDIYPDLSEDKTLSFCKTIWSEDGTTSSSKLMDVRWLYTLTPVPEPSSALLLGAGTLALCLCRRRRRSRGNAQ